MSSPIRPDPLTTGTPQKNPLPDLGGQQATPGGSFASEMGNTSSASSPSAPGPAETPPPPGTPSMNSLVAQIGQTQDGMSQLNTQLNNPALRLKRSQEHLLQSKLSDASSYIGGVSDKLGIAQMAPAPSQGGPVERFLSFVGNGQDQLVAIKQKLTELAAHGDQLNPGDMLLVQVKLNQAQQEIDYATTLLGKVMDAIKTILNTPL